MASNINKLFNTKYRGTDSYFHNNEQFCEELGGIWVPPYKRKDGTYVDGHCRKYPSDKEFEDEAGRSLRM